MTSVANTRTTRRPRHVLLHVVLAVAVLLGLGATPAAADGGTTPSSTPAATTVGSTERTTATPITGGLRSLDTTIDDSRTRYYRVDRTIPGSTIDVGVSAAFDPADERVRIEATLETLDGESCAEETASPVTGFDVFGDASVSLTASALRPDTGVCGSADSVVLAVDLTRTGTGPGQGEPVDLELLVGEEPPAANLAALPAPDPTVPAPAPLPAADGSAGTISPGTDYASAPIAASGSYAGSIAPGATQYVTVPLDYGQRLTVNVRFDAVDDVATTARPNAALAIRNPYRGVVSPSQVRDADGNGPNGALSSDETTSFTAVSFDVSYLSRGLDFGAGRSGNTSEADASTAGPYTIALALGTPPWGDAAEQYTYTLTFQVSGEAGVGAPEYESGGPLVPWPVDPVGPPGIAVGLAIAGAVLVLGGATSLVVLLVRRRPAR
ncbi:hypothetical protein F8O01_01920 [Pseudoclavibacter chungangensis]|uniref:Cell wall protein n=1 Tax=Pseudoclavibacter chungangensis TaxID=587635 RepID=A0A7J5C0U4_9MICO|nr:hypothetical protein [Pseudoclavibacter chungangensis]KAB1662239.1 hypothetical protein F8O01_01920 [Pseudoclavibacter chungangensis]NYJ65444.1 hypothetical protein [Pseudoclavibacter chungangensis]